MLAFEILDNTIREWLLAAAVIFVLTGILILIRNFTARRISRTSDEKQHRLVKLIREIVGRTKPILLLLLSVYAASVVLTIPPGAAAILRIIAFAAVFVQIGLWGNYFIANGIHRYYSRTPEEKPPGSAMYMISLAGRTILWSFIFLVILENIGVNVTTLIASLGVGGIAIALATQSILSDLFASLSILLDRPFEVGHFIIVGDHLGSVEKIGLKTTRIRSLSGELIIFGNNDLLQSRIRNFTHFQERRVVFKFGVLYGTPAEKLKKIPGMVREIIEKTDNTRFDRAHFMAFGDYSLLFEIVYYVLSPDYTEYMNIQEKINFAILERFEEEGIQFAFPTRTVHIAGQPGENISATPYCSSPQP